MLQWFRSRRFPLEREVGRPVVVRSVNGVKGGFVVVSCMRLHAKAERSQQTRKPRRRGEAAGILFFSPYFYICARRGIAARLFIDHGRRDAEASPRGGVLKRLCLLAECTTRCVVQRKGNPDSGNRKITGALRAKMKSFGMHPPR